MDSRSERRWWTRCRVAATLAVVAAFLVVNARQAPGAQAAKEVDHCVSPSGLDLNEFFGIAEQIVTPFCPEAEAGRQWTVAVRWVMGQTFAVAPEGFVPAGDTPLADFVAKFVAVKYVVDPGTAQAKSYVFPSSDALATGPAPDGFSFVETTTLGTLHPLSVGDHVVEVYWVFSAMHCDGIGVAIPDNCLPAGDVLVGTFPFSVTPGHH